MIIGAIRAAMIPRFIHRLIFAIQRALGWQARRGTILNNRIHRFQSAIHRKCTGVAERVRHRVGRSVEYKLGICDGRLDALARGRRGAGTHASGDWVRGNRQRRNGVANSHLCRRTERQCHDCYRTQQNFNPVFHTSSSSGGCVSYDRENPNYYKRIIVNKWLTAPAAAAGRHSLMKW